MRFLKFGILTIFLAGSLVVFQNCGGNGLVVSQSIGSSLDNEYHNDGGEGHTCGLENCHDFVEKIEPTKYLSQLGSVEYVHSVFRDIFLLSYEDLSEDQKAFVTEEAADERNEKLLDILESQLLSNRHFFGGRCTHYDGEDCFAPGKDRQVFNYREDQNFDGLEVNGVATVSREGVRMQVCDSILAEDDLVDSALTNAGLRFTSVFTDENMRSIFQLFYPELEGGEALAYLIESGKKLDSGSLHQQWKDSLKLLCYSGEWQYY